MIEVIRWDAPGPYEIAFSTRKGGVSEGAYASLNLGLKTADEPEHVAENRRLLCAQVGVAPESISMTWQRHSAVVHRAAPGERPDGDGVWTDAPGEAVLQLTADCVPIAIARAAGAPAVAVLHAGWRGLLAGVVAAGVEALGPGPLAAAVGPSIGPCCYEVGPEVAEPFGVRRDARPKPRPVGRLRASAPRRRRRERRARGSLYRLQPRPLLLAPA